MRDTGLRARAVLEDWWVVMVVGLVVLTLAGGWVTYDAVVAPGTHLEERPGPETTSVGEFSHGATVTEPNPVFSTGAELENRTTYFTAIAPVLDGAFVYRYSAEESGSLDTRASLDLVIRGVEEGADGGTSTSWQITRSLAATNATLDPGESLRLDFERNVSALANETEQIDRALGGHPGTIETAIVAEVETTGQVNGQDVDTERRYELGIVPEGGTYRVEDPGAVTNTSQQTRMVERPNSASPLQRAGGPLLLALGLLGLAGLGFSQYRGALELSDEERAYLDYRSTRAEFDEWVTVGRVPPEALDRPTVEVDSLEGLVDVAIDSDRRVIESPRGDRYRVAVDDLLYQYDAPPAPSDRAEPLSVELGEGEADE